MVYLGADPGRWKTALAVVARYPEHYRVRQVEAVDNAHLVERALELVSLYGVSRAVVERTSRGPWKRQVPKRELAEIAALGQALTKALEGAGVPVEFPLLFPSIPPGFGAGRESPSGKGSSPTPAPGRHSFRPVSRVSALTRGETSPHTSAEAGEGSPFSG